MHALSFDKHFAFCRFETVYNRELPVAGISDFFQCVVTFYVRNEIAVRFGTRHFAGSTPDTPGRIDKYPDEFLVFFGFVRSLILYG